LAKLNSQQDLLPAEQREALKFKYAKGLIDRPNEIHAVCEVRERKRNAQFGMAPTIAEAYEIVTAFSSDGSPETESDNVPEMQFFKPELLSR
jgi:hypothetical protein